VQEVLEHEDFNNACDACGSRDLQVTGWSEVVRINLLPVRPDMFDPAGLARALRGFLGIETGMPSYEFGRSGFDCRVAAGMEAIRPFIGACVVRGLALDEEGLKMLMKMQENLHWALGRDRRRASIGVYDLDTLQPGFEFRPVEPDGVRFVPLFGMPGSQSSAVCREPVTPKEILAAHPKGRAYAYLLAGMSRYPLLVDSAGTVLSMPPIINSDATRVTEKTRNLFVDVTGPDRDAVGRTLCVIAAALADGGGRVETVLVEYADGRACETPDMTPATMKLSPKEACRVLGFELEPDEMAACLGRMRHSAASGKSRTARSRIAVRIPAYRADVMHEYDLIEDVAIGYGFHRVQPRLVPAMTVGRPQKPEELSETCRRALTGLGLLETMTLLLTNPETHFRRLRQEDDGRCPRIENPAGSEQTIVRRHLLSGLLDTFRVNTAAEMPQHIFEVGDCFELDDEAETGTRMRRKAGIGMTGPKAGYAELKSVVEAVAAEFDLEPRFEPVEHPTFIPGRAAFIRARRAGRGFEWGVAGEVHPEVLEQFGLGQPAALAELDLSVLLE
jgi:phenylalanyl-tRNA synthetase beta chain